MSYTPVESAWRSRRPAGPRAAAAIAASTSPVIVIRPARAGDESALHDLALLDSAPALVGPVLVAVVAGRIWAAYGLDDDRAIADPFAPSAAAVGLLRLRAGQLREAHVPRALRRRLAGRIPSAARRTGT